MAEIVFYRLDPEGVIKIHKVERFTEVTVTGQGGRREGASAKGGWQAGSGEWGGGQSVVEV